jgi:acetyl esterase
MNVAAGPQCPSVSTPSPTAKWQDRVDPELATVLPYIPDMDLSDVSKARESLASLVQQAPREIPGVESLEVADHLVPSLNDAPPVPVRVYRRKDLASSVPGILWIHGGGFVLGSVDLEHASTADLALNLGVVVVSVEYRLAPEHPFPAGLDDCYAALVWTAEQSVELGIDPGRLAVGGMSAGGGLSAAVALRSRDQAGPALCFQLLGIPDLDDRLDTPSMVEFEDTPMWNRRLAVQSWAYYLGEDPGTYPGEARPQVSPYAAPAREPNLAGLPPAYLSTGELDPLRDEGIDYATRMIRAGVPVELHHFPGAFHGSALATGARVSQRMHEDVMEALKRGLRLQS